jgi:hypothetical protein
MNFGATFAHVDMVETQRPFHHLHTPLATQVLHNPTHVTHTAIGADTSARSLRGIAVTTNLRWSLPVLRDGLSLADLPTQESFCSGAVKDLEAGHGFAVVNLCHLDRDR